MYVNRSGNAKTSQRQNYVTLQTPEIQLKYYEWTVFFIFRVTFVIFLFFLYFIYFCRQVKVITLQRKLKKHSENKKKKLNK